MKISIIGTGRIGVLLESDVLRYKPCTHLGAICILCQKKRSLQVDYLCDINPERLKFAYMYAKNHGIKKDLKTTDDYKIAINQKPDILVIAADTMIHYEIMIQAIKAGIKKIVIEKPVCLNRKEAAKLHNIVKKSGTNVWVNYERRYHPKYMKLKNYIEFEKPYGRLLHYRGWFASTNSSLYQKGKFTEGALLHDTTHLLDLVQFFCGKISLSRSQVETMQNQSSLHKLLLKHKNNLIGEIWTTTSNSFFNFEIELIFENGRINVGNGFISEQKAQKSKLYENFVSLEKPKLEVDGKMKVSSNPFVKLYTDVIGDIYQENYFEDACENVLLLT